MFDKKPCEACGKLVRGVFCKFEGKRLCRDCYRKAKGLGCKICGKSVYQVWQVYKSEYCVECIRANPELDFKAHEHACCTGVIPASESRSSCRGCAYLSRDEELVFTDSVFAYNETDVTFRCLKLNIELRDTAYDCPHRKTAEEVIHERR